MSSLNFAFEFHPHHYGVGIVDYSAWAWWSKTGLVTSIGVFFPFFRTVLNLMVVGKKLLLVLLAFFLWSIKSYILLKETCHHVWLKGFRFSKYLEEFPVSKKRPLSFIPKLGTQFDFTTFILKFVKHVTFITIDYFDAFRGPLYQIFWVYPETSIAEMSY